MNTTTPALPLLNRRRFLGSCAALSATPLLSSLPAAGVFSGSGKIKVGLVGCGGRGNGALRNCLDADPGVVVHALGDLFPDRLDASFSVLSKGEPEKKNGKKPVPADRLQVGDRRFSGFDAFQHVLNSGIDLVILATPPQFRPAHIEAAVEKGVHVFAEKPVAVDAPGARRVIAAGEKARAKGLTLVAGTQRRYAANYIEALKRVRDGAIGDLVGGQIYWCTGGLWHKTRQPDWSEMEYQIRNWLYFTWLSGDHIVEQHVHNIDVANWAFGGPPVKAIGLGGRQSRTDPKYGNIFDHFAVEFEYANGARVQSFCRQAPGASNRVGERLVGTKGVATPAKGITGANPWRFEGETPNALVDEHVALTRSIREGRGINDARQVAESTLTAILGRVSAYTGRELNYNWLVNASKQDLSPATLALNAQPPSSPIAIPGKTTLE